jgi:drug/metabolite transporter (DMT)-like permease
MKKLSLFYIILASVLWGTSVIFFNLLSPFGFSPVELTTLRALVAAIIMSGYALIFKRDLFKVNIKELLLFALSGISVFGTASCYFMSMKLTSASTAVVLMYTAPVFVMIYSVMFLSEKMTKTKIISVVLMIFGCTFVSGILNGFKFNVSGILIGLASGISYSLYNILTRIEMMKKYDSTKASLYCFIFFAISSLFVSNPENIFNTAMKNPVLIVLFAFLMGLSTSALPYFFYTKALKVIPAGTATSLGIIEPMSATLFSVFVFGEVLSVVSIIGIVLILVSVFILSIEKE